MVRASFVLAKKRHAYLDELPWLIARMLQPGVKALCVQKYLEADKHHPVSHMFFAEGGSLKAEVDALDHGPASLSSCSGLWNRYLRFHSTTLSPNLPTQQATT